MFLSTSCDEQPIASPFWPTCRQPLHHSKHRLAEQAKNLSQEFL